MSILRGRQVRTGPVPAAHSSSSTWTENHLAFAVPAANNHDAGLFLGQYLGFFFGLS